MGCLIMILPESIILLLHRYVSCGIMKQECLEKPVKPEKLIKNIIYIRAHKVCMGGEK